MTTGTKINVRIVRLDPVRVAAAYGFGPSPEAIAWDKLLSWAKAQGLLGGDTQPRFFGFDNPMPTPGSPNYGYEQWLVVGPEVEGNDDITIKDFPGGLYAVTRCKLPQIGEAWRALVAWREDSRYRSAPHQCLEEVLTPPGTPFEDMVFDIYLAVAEPQ